MSLPRTDAKMGVRRNSKLAVRNPKPGRAFTLIELVVVISVIAILMGLLFPAFRGVQDQAKKTQAKSDLTQIATAVNAFYTEYGRYPTSATTNATATLGPGGSTPENGGLFNELRAITFVLNTRKIVYLSPPEAKNQTAPRSGIETATGGYYDPWGNEYAIALDAEYGGTLTNPYGSNGAGSDPVHQGVITWSLGNDAKLGNNGDGKFTSSDDVVSWQ